MIQLRLPFILLTIFGIFTGLNSCKDVPIVAIHANDPAIQYFGRFVPTDSNSMIFSWSGSEIRLKFRGSGIKAKIKSNAPEDGKYDENYFDLIVDGGNPEMIKLERGIHWINLCESLADTIHELTIYRRTEMKCGTTELIKIAPSKGGELLNSEVRFDKKFLFIGNSITAAYGNDEMDGLEPYRPVTQNHYRGYAALTTRALNAEAHYICVSGKGIYRNYNGDTVGTMRDLMKFSEANSESAWDNKKWTPDLVVFNLGTNDLAKGLPDEEKLISAYSELINSLCEDYPKAKILALTGPMLSEDNATFLSSVIRKSIDRSNEKFPNEMEIFAMSKQGSFGYGANYHPSVRQHEVNAQELAIFLRKWLN